MSFSKVFSAQVYLLHPHIIDVEVDIAKGMNAFSIVGLGDKAVNESKDRVSASIKNCGFESPKSQNHKTIVSLAPADLRKEGPNFDVAIALAYLLAVDAVRFETKSRLFLGELALNGQLRSIKGALPLVIEAKKRGFKEVYLPKENAKEASILSGIAIFGTTHLKEIIEHLNVKITDDESYNEKGERIERERKELIPCPLIVPVKKNIRHTIDFEDIRGQEGAKRALEIAAAGGHNIMMHGPPGTGKTMMAKAFSGLLPELSFDEMLEVTSIHSSSGISSELIQDPPFRAPHHTSSYVSLVGGGPYPKPGETTLAHKGVLFLDEFPEFDVKVIESLRQPLEDRVITISRMKGSVTFPSDFILIASMNPCPCGWNGSKQRQCYCNLKYIQNYQRKISGPIADRIDLWSEVSEVDYQKLGSNVKEESTNHIIERVKDARMIQKNRSSRGNKNTLHHDYLNSRIDSKDLELFCHLSDICRRTLDSSAKKLNISARVYHRIIKIARTIADLEKKDHIDQAHILEALQYRPKLKVLQS